MAWHCTVAMRDCGRMYAKRRFKTGRWMMHRLRKAVVRLGIYASRTGWDGAFGICMMMTGGIILPVESAGVVFAAEKWENDIAEIGIFVASVAGFFCWRALVS